MREVEIDPMPLERWAAVLEPERYARLMATAEQARGLLGSRTIWNVNATATGGGVAEMLRFLLSYSRGAGVDIRWLVLDGTAEFFRITKRVHNVLHGSAGDGGPLGDMERAVYDRVLALNLEHLAGLVQPGDFVLLHDPQTAGMIAPLRELGAQVIWRCHIGLDEQTLVSQRGWSFLRPYVEAASAVVFSRDSYTPDWLTGTEVRIVPPSIDPFSAKNADLSVDDVRAALRQAGLVAFPDNEGSLTFTRRDGGTGTLRPHTDLVVAGEPVPADADLVLQISRWDHLKDMQGVMEGFTRHLASFPPRTHLMLVGPAVAGVSDDPEGAMVLRECIEAWSLLPQEALERVHLVCLPMDDIDENAHLVNALQRFAAVVVQKSLVEGFGLTVTEPMWKGRAVLASAVGGIRDQIEDGVSGVLLADPADLDAFADELGRLIADADLRARLGSAARETVRDRFLGDRHLIQWVELFGDLEAASDRRG